MYTLDCTKKLLYRIKASPAHRRQRPPGAKTKAVKGAKPVRFRDGAGNTRVGRGPRPQWVQDALASGKKLGDFAV